jgi:hypothetical protein
MSFPEVTPTHQSRRYRLADSRLGWNAAPRVGSRQPENVRAVGPGLKDEI